MSAIPEEQWVRCEESELRPGMTVRVLQDNGLVLGPFLILGTQDPWPRHSRTWPPTWEPCKARVAWRTTLWSRPTCFCMVPSHGRLERLRDLDASQERADRIMCDLDDMRRRRERLKSDDR